MERQSSDERAAANRQRALVLLSAVALVVGVVVFAVLAIVGLRVAALVAAVIVAGGVAGLIWWRSDEVALRLSGAVPADRATHARLHNLLDSLCIASGLPKPAVYVIDDLAPNAFAVGRRPQDASVVVTVGLLDGLDRMELEAVLAHELSHIRNGDIAMSTLAVTTLGLIAPSLVPRVVVAGRESMADASAVKITRFPPGLISALEKLQDPPATMATRSRALDHLWIERPDAGAERSNPTGERSSSTHPPLDERVAVLREL